MATSISEYLKDYQMMEGYSQQVPEQVKDLIHFTTKPHIQVMEIGFNGGHSAEIFLKNNPTLHLTSFDLGAHPYVLKAKEYIDLTYPNRHTLILGDSTITIPNFVKENPNKKFDILFIDGGHDYKIAKSDINNCYHLAHKESIVIMDDTIYTKYWDARWTEGPTRSWLDSIKEGKITEISHRDYCRGRGISWGKYNL